MESVERKRATVVVRIRHGTAPLPENLCWEGQRVAWENDSGQGISGFLPFGVFG
jgi:hypothetical protein